MSSLANIQAIATLHGIAVGCNTMSLKSYVREHSCSKCTGHVTMFSIEKNAAEKQVDCTVKYVAKANAINVLNSLSFMIPFSFLGPLVCTSICTHVPTNTKL